MKMIAANKLIRFMFNPFNKRSRWWLNCLLAVRTDRRSFLRLVRCFGRRCWRGNGRRRCSYSSPSHPSRHKRSPSRFLILLSGRSLYQFKAKSVIGIGWLGLEITSEVARWNAGKDGEQQRSCHIFASFQFYYRFPFENCQFSIFFRSKNTFGTMNNKSRFYSRTNLALGGAI